MTVTITGIIPIKNVSEELTLLASNKCKQVIAANVGNCFCHHTMYIVFGYMATNDIEICAVHAINKMCLFIN